jgi:hypothetical protein
MGRTVYRASRFRIAILVMVCTTLAVTLVLPWLGDYLRHAALVGRWSFNNGTGVAELIALAYATAALFAACAIALGRFLIDNTVVVLDVEGITVRHVFSTERGYWDEFEDARSFGRTSHKNVCLRFHGIRGRKRVEFPAEIIGINLRAVSDEVVSRMSLPSIHRETRARIERVVALNPPPIRPIDIGLGRKRIFGHRPATEAVETGHNSFDA